MDRLSLVARLERFRFLWLAGLLILGVGSVGFFGPEFGLFTLAGSVAVALTLGYEVSRPHFKRMFWERLVQVAVYGAAGSPIVAVVWLAAFSGLFSLREELVYAPLMASPALMVVGGLAASTLIVRKRGMQIEARRARFLMVYGLSVAVVALTLMGIVGMVGGEQSLVGNLLLVAVPALILAAVALAVLPPWALYRIVCPAAGRVAPPTPFPIPEPPTSAPTFQRAGYR